MAGLIRVIVPLLATWLKEEEKRHGGGRKDSAITHWDDDLISTKGET